MSYNKQNSSWGLAFITGLATGWVINMLIPQETKRKAGRTIKELMTDPDKQAELRGKVIDNYSFAKDQLVTRLQNLKMSADQIDKQKYMEVVDEVINQMKGEKDIATKQLGRLRSYLEADFQLLKTSQSTAQPPSEIE